VATREERELVEAASKGSVAALDRLFDRCWPVAWRVAYSVTGSREVADDVALEALFRAFRALDRFDVTRPLDPWLKRIALNVALRESANDRKLAEAEGRYEELWTAPRWDEQADPGAGAVAAALAGLPLAKRLVVVLHYWLDLTLEDIAMALDIPVGTVTSRLSRALSELKAVLEEDHVRRS
jgi:RNA polymerase sigma-70 factor, ECF subfamily